MTLKQYWVIIIKQWRLILLCFLGVGLGAYIGSKLVTPLYQSTALVQVVVHSSSNQSDINNLLASDQLVQTEAQLAISSPVLHEVASHYPGLRADQLTKAVTSTTQLNTQLFNITVLDASPTRAAALANDIAATLIKQQIQISQQENMQLQRQIAQDLDTTRLQIDATTNRIAVLQGQAGSQSQITILQTQLTGLQQHYSQQQAELAQLELTQAQNRNFMRIAQNAQPSLGPVQPNTFLNTGGGLLGGLFLGIFLAVLIEQLDTRVRTSEALTQLLNWSVLATIWLVDSSKKEILKKEDIIHYKGRGANVEAYRILQTNIEFSTVDTPVRTLMITSALPRDGRSVTAANLAIFMAKAGKNTLLIDADLRHPIQHTFFGLPATQLGLSDAVLASGASSTSTDSLTDRKLLSEAPTSQELSLETFIHSVGIPNLWLMPSGPLPANPSELWDSKAIQRLFVAIENSEAEIVIFDTPPLLGLSDGSVLASKVDGVLVLIDITRAHRKHLLQVQARLTQIGARVLGCIVNKQQRNRKDISCYDADEQNSVEYLSKNNSTVSVLTNSVWQR